MCVHSSSYIYRFAYMSLSCKAVFCSLIIGTGTGKMLSFILPLLEKVSAEGFTRNDHGRPCTAGAHHNDSHWRTGHSGIICLEPLLNCQSRFKF